MIRMARRRCSKEMAKNSYSLTKDHAQSAQRQVNDEVVNVVGGSEEATAEKTMG